MAKDDDFLTDAETELLRLIRSRLGVKAFDLPPRLRPGLPRLERRKLIYYHNGKWYPRAWR